jgi:hypothetical protein
MGGFDEIDNDHILLFKIASIKIKGRHHQSESNQTIQEGAYYTECWSYRSRLKEKELEF